MRSPKKLLFLLVGLLVVVIGGLVLARQMGWIKTTEPGLEVEVATAERRTITQTVTGSGKVEPEVEVKISSDVSGEIVVLTVQEGDRVTAGQLLIQVQPEFYVAQRDQAGAGLLQAQADSARTAAELARARADLERQRSLFERGAIARADLDAAQAAFDVARASLDAATFRTRSARATLRQSSQELRKTSIYAPITGIVSQLNVELGERVVGTSQMAGTEIMRIAELDEMLIEVDINENDIVNVVLDDTAGVEIDAFPDQSFRGRVTQIANSARISGMGTAEQITNFPVEIKIVNVPAPGSGSATRSGPAAQAAAETPVRPVSLVSPLRPGMSGTVDIFTHTVPNALVVPIQAVTVRDFNRLERYEETQPGRRPPEDDEAEETPATATDEDLRRVVFVIRDGKAEVVEVQTGISDDTHIEILSGLNEGDQVITGPFRALRTDLKPGQPVRERGAPKEE